MNINFQNVAPANGLVYIGPSFGVSWGDYDHDGRPDLFLNNHDMPSSIYRNLGPSGFVDVTDLVIGDLSGDVHGGAWADMDSDGDADLLIAVGDSSGNVRGPNRLLVNSNGTFIESAKALGVDMPFGRGRTPLWLDWNGDRFLDAVIANIKRTDDQAPTTIFTQAGGVFIDDSASLGFNTDANDYFSQLIYISGYTKPLILVHTVWGFPDRIFDTNTVPFSDVTLALGLPPAGAVNDVAVGDFDGDLETEFYLARALSKSVAVQTDSIEIRAKIYGYESTNTMGFGFETQGTLDVELGAPWKIPVNALFIGSNGSHPSSQSFSLDPADPSTWGEPTLPPETTGIKIFLDTETARWRILVDGDWQPDILISASDIISNLQTEGFVSDSGAMPDYLLDRIVGMYQNVGAASAVGSSKPCVSVVAADFDNDMDLDIYLVCTDSAHNLANVLLENNGTGFFTEVSGAAGAVGSSLGRGESAAVADYDSNGFLDILVTNGRGEPPLYFDGPTELFQNMGNSNHWLEIELVGISSNADGIGTTVIVDAGGKQQIRFQGGGMHLYSQDHSRLHFGLAGNTVIDQILINWPSGLQQTLTDIPADQVIKFTEPAVDTDNDGFPDFMEIAAGYDPLDGTNFPVWGDINDDRVVNTVDVLLATRSIMGMLTLTDAELARGDVAPLINGKPQPPAVGVFDLADLLLISRKALGAVTF